MMTKSQTAILTRVFGISAIMFVLGGLMIYWESKPTGTHPRSSATPATNYSHSQNSAPNTKTGLVTRAPRPSSLTIRRIPVVKNEKQSPAKGRTEREYEDYLRKGPLVVNPTPRQDSKEPEGNQSGRPDVSPDYRRTPTFPRTTKKDELGDRLERVAKDAIKEGLKRIFR